MLCPYCNNPMVDRGGRTRDHIIPVFHGGTDDRRNIIHACKTCNGNKANWMLAEWAALLRREDDPRADRVEQFAAAFAPIAAAFEAERRLAVIAAAKSRKSMRDQKRAADMEAAEQRRAERRAERRAAYEAKERKTEANRERVAALRAALLASHPAANQYRNHDVRYIPDYLVDDYISKGWEIDPAPASCGSVLMRKKRASRTPSLKNQETLLRLTLDNLSKARSRHGGAQA